MPLDTNIAMGIRPIEQPNMLAQMGQAMAIRQANDEYQSNNALKDFYAQGGDLSKPEDQRRLMSTVGAKGADLIAKQAALEKTKAEVKQLGYKNVESAFNQSREALSAIDPSAPNAGALLMAWHEANHKDPVMGSILATSGIDAASSRAALQASIAKGPAGIQEAIRRSSMGQAKYQGELMQTERAHIAAAPGNRNATVNEQRLAADQAPLAVDDKTIDLVANRYLIDGTLPPLGMGKPAAMLRAKILDRAQAIATAPPAATSPPSAPVNPQAKMPPPAATGAAPVVNNLNPAPTAAAPVVNNLVAPPVVPPAPIATPAVAPVSVTPQQAAQNIVTSKVDTATRKKALTDFSTGVQGRQVNSMNTAINHLETLSDLADALKNNDLRAVNTVGNILSKQTGEAAPTNFAAARDFVSKEIVKAIIANGGTGGERAEAAANISAANSPEQLAGVISTYKELLAGQLESLGLQYKNTTGRDDFHTKLLPATIKALSRKPSEAASAAETSSSGRTVVRTGTQNGRKVIQYSDGSIEYGN